MDRLARIVLIVLYPLLLGARVVNALTGRDPLRLKEPAGSCWIERMPAPAPRRYFSESDVAERRSWPFRVLTRIAHAFAPPATGDAGRARGTAMPDDIPDEVYTLW
jgi:hypothetical protein